MSIPKMLSDTYLFETAELVHAGEFSLEEGSRRLIAASEWGHPSDGEMNHVDTLIQKLIQEQQEPHFAYVFAELNLAVCKEVGSPSQEVICANTVGEAISALKDPRLTPRRIEVYTSALEISEKSGDRRRAAILYNNLGNAYSELTTGDLQENIRAAIDCFEQALTVFTLEIAPSAWASIQNNLATVYKMKPGNDDQNIRPAIACWDKALTIFQKDNYPFEWANVQRNLGIAYKDLNTGDPVENLTRARNHLLSALEIFTLDQQPILWAEVQNVLGNVFFRATTGNRTENLKQAIVCFEDALTVRMPETYPVQFAGTQVNLGNAWLSLPTGDRKENLHKAINCYEDALTVYSPNDFPELNAQVHTNLAAAYLYYPAGDRAQNLRRAEQDLKIALTVFTKPHDPSQYAWCKSTQGAVYQEMARNDPAYKSESIACYDAALDVYTEASFPADFARVIDALGTLYRSQIDGNVQENFQKAEQCYQAALRVYQPEVYPDDWASTQTNLGNCYLFWPAADRSQTLPKAIECYQAALSIHTRERFPLDYARLMDGLATAYDILSDQNAEFRKDSVRCLQEAWKATTQIGASNEIVRIAGNGGSLYWRRREWALAYEWLARAIRTLEEMWEEHYSLVGKMALQEEYAALYIRIVQSCNALGRKEDTLYYVEHSRSRSLLSLFAETIKQLPIAPPPIREKLTRLSALSEDLRSMESAMAFALSPEQTLNLIRQQERLREERKNILSSMANELPEYVSLRWGQPLEFQSLRKMLRID